MASFVILVFILCVKTQEVWGRTCLGDNFIGCNCEEDDYMACEWIYFQGNEVSLDSLSTSVIFIQDVGVDVSTYNMNVWPSLKEVITPLGIFICAEGYCMMEEQRKNDISIITPSENTILRLFLTGKDTTTNSPKVENDLSSMATTEDIKFAASLAATSIVKQGEMGSYNTVVTTKDSSFGTWGMRPTIKQRGLVGYSARSVNEESNTLGTVFIELTSEPSNVATTEDSSFGSWNVTPTIYQRRIMNYTSGYRVVQTKSLDWEKLFLITSCILGVIILFLIVTMIVGYIYMKKHSTVRIESPQQWEWADL